MSTLKGRNAHKGRTFGGVAACPHCSHPIRAYVTAARTQCLLDLVSVGYLVPPYVPLVDDDYAYGEGNIMTATRDAGVAVSAVSAITGTGALTADSGTVAPNAVHHSEDRGWDDDEAPFPPSGGAQVGLLEHAATRRE